MIDHSCLRQNGRINGGQGNIGSDDRHILAGIILIPGRFIQPIGKFIAAGRGQGAFDRLGLAARAISVAVHRSCAGTVAGQISHMIRIAHEHGSDGNVRIQRFVNVDQFAGANDHPLEQRLIVAGDISKRVFIVRAGGDGCSGGNDKRLIKRANVGDGDGDTDVDLGLSPVSEICCVRRGHCSLGKIDRSCRIGNLRDRHIIPAYEYRLTAEAFRPGRRGIVLAQRSAVLDRIACQRAVIIQNKIIGITGIIQIFVIIPIASG